jgi:HSP20 family protein
MAKKEVAAKSETEKTPSLLGGDVDRLFDEFARGMMVSPFYRRALDWDPFRRIEKITGVVMPDVDVTETDTELRISAELPGMEEKDVEIELSGNQLTVRGEKKEEREETKKDFHVSERRYGSFRRTLQVPETVDAEKIDAEMKNGVLTVVLPKTEEAKSKARKISVKKG